MIIYRKMKIEGENHPCHGLWYARPVITETLDIVALSKHMAKHNTPFSPGVIKGVLADMVACIKELILDGKNVKLDDLAIFSVGIVSDHGAESAEAFKVTEHVKGLKLRARATGELSNAQINLEGQLREATPYAVDGSTGTTTPGTGTNPDEEDGQEPGSGDEDSFG
ncbi:MAG TPA: DNA-binding protein [Candidatus Bacteroides pullicola]|uniref:DNA-binding protein n=1 Tax=Candidatus Bacteroides pullicola TaxID=2838475 RepID=A0A9D1ZF20_9BACE|nr:DNA-binding protein [Candidatus Bacteroides pullicola]